jgi:hypothetical protein
MTARAIDPMGTYVDYLTVTRWSIDATDNTIHMYNDKELIASVPGDWIVRILPHDVEIDPGVEARE